jgi:hypothetical protein
VRSFISYLVAGCLALHTLLGCCAHHAHAEHAQLGAICESCDHAGHDDHACDGHDHDDAVEADGIETEGVAATDGHDEPSAPCSGSCGDKCQFVTTGRVQLESPVVATDFAPTPCQVVDVAADLPWVRSEAWLTGPPPLPLRLHLWNGLLLI